MPNAALKDGIGPSGNRDLYLVGQTAHRSELFLTTKIHPRHFAYDSTLDVFVTSLVGHIIEEIELPVSHLIPHDFGPGELAA